MRFLHSLSSPPLLHKGLPARGKSFTARKLSRFLSWQGYRTEIFNAGRYRRRAEVEVEDVGGPSQAKSHAEFFSKGNKEAAALREGAAKAALDDVVRFFERGTSTDI